METTPPSQVRGKIPSYTKLVPGAKKVGDHCWRGKASFGERHFLGAGLTWGVVLAFL